MSKNQQFELLQSSKPQLQRGSSNDFNFYANPSSFPTNSVIPRSEDSRNLKSNHSYSRGSLLSISNSKCSSPESDVGSSFEIDSGFGSARTNKTNSHWNKVDEKLFHTDLKKFMKKNVFSLKRNLEFSSRKPMLPSRSKAIFDDCNNESDDSLDSSIISLIDSNNSSNEETLKSSLVSLCSSISKYMLVRNHIEQGIFQLNGDMLRYHFELKQLLHFDASSSLIAEKMPRILDLLYNDMNIIGVEMLFKQLEKFCREQNLPVENDEAGSENLTQSIELLRISLMAFIQNESPKTFEGLNNSINCLNDIIRSNSIRMWILTSLVGF